jgi:hypothetical protein
MIQLDSPAFLRLSKLLHGPANISKSGPLLTNEYTYNLLFNDDILS